MEYHSLFRFGVNKALSARFGALAEPWDEGDRIEWAKMAVDRVTWQWLCGMPTPALRRGRLPSHWRPPLPGVAARGPPHTRWPTATRPGLTRVGQRNHDR